MNLRRIFKNPNKNSGAQVIEEVNQFLKELNLCMANKCDIFEHTLLKLAGITEYGRCQFGTYGERINISIGNLKLTDAEKFLAFFHSKGDITAKIIHSCYKESENLEYDENTDSYGINKPIVSISISSDKFYKTIFPIFKATIIETQRNHPVLLEPYLPKATTKDMPARLFSPSTVSQEPRDQTIHSDKVLVFAASK